MPNQLLNIGGVDAVHDVEKVAARDCALLRNLVRHVLHELCYICHVRVQVLNRQLVVVGHCHQLDFAEWHQLFLARKHLSQKVYGVSRFET